MKRIVLVILLPFFVQCVGMTEHPILPDEDYKKYANDLLKSFERFGARENYCADLEKYMLDTIRDCSSADKNILIAATLIMNPAYMKWQIPDPKTPAEWICIMFAQQMDTLFNHRMYFALQVQLKHSPKNFKFDTLCKGKQIFAVRMAEAKKYAKTVLTILNAK